MKPTPDLAGILINRTLRAIGHKKKFVRLWGHDGNTLNEKIYYYPRKRLEANKEIFKFLGMYNDLKTGIEDMEGVDKAWVFINPNKISITTDENGNTLYGNDIVVPAGSVVASKLEQMLPIGEEFVIPVSIVYANASNIQSRLWIRQSELEQATHPVFNPVGDTATIEERKELIKEYMISSWGTILDECYVQAHDEIEGNELWIDAPLGQVATYALLSPALDVQIENISKELLPRTVVNDSSSEQYKYTVYDSVVQVKLRIKRIEAIANDDPMVVRMTTKPETNQWANAEVKQEVSEGSVSSISFIKPTVNNAIFSGGRVRLEALGLKVVNGKLTRSTGIGIKSKDILPLLQKALDSDYKKEKTKWYKKLLAIVLVVVVTLFVGPWAANVVGAAAGSIVSVAVYATVATLAATLISMYAKSVGDYGLADFTGKIAGITGMVAMVAGIMNLVASVTRSLAVASREIAIQQATAQAGGPITQGVYEGIMSSSTITLDGVIKAATDAITSQVTNISWKQVVNFGLKAFEKIEMNKLEKLQNEASNLAKEAKELEEKRLEEEARTRDLHAMMMTTFTNPLDMEYNKYDYDYPYEGTSRNVSKQFFPCYNRLVKIEPTGEIKVR